MVTNFESKTEVLSREELALIPLIINGMSGHKKSNPIKAIDIVEGMKKIAKSFNDRRLRKLVNHIRSSGMMAIIATEKGYYSTTDINEINEQITSLHDRSSAIENSARGLEMYKQQLIKEQNHEY